jgi:ParB/RepB/Spo0J family partition protein
MSNRIENRTLSEIGKTYAALRLVDPKADAAIVRSMETYGQLSPIVCLKTPGGLELLDGFKRLRGAFALKYETIQLMAIETTERAGKAGMIRLNRIAKTITDIEEALILRTLHRDDGMNQVEIAKLLDRDKSWVSRRISLVERMHEEVWKSLELGLICVSVARELARLPQATNPRFCRRLSNTGWESVTWRRSFAAFSNGRHTPMRSFSTIFRNSSHRILPRPRHPAASFANSLNLRLSTKPFCMESSKSSCRRNPARSP